MGILLNVNICQFKPQSPLSGDVCGELFFIVKWTPCGEGKIHTVTPLLTGSVQHSIICEAGNSLLLSRVSTDKIKKQIPLSGDTCGELSFIVKRTPDGEGMLGVRLPNF